MVSSRHVTQGIILTVVIGLSLVLAVGIWKGKHQPEKPMVEPSSGPEAQMSLTDMDYTEMEGGRRAWTLKADGAQYFQRRQKTHLNGVQLTLYMQNGDEIYMESREGILYAGSKNIELWGAIRAMLPQGYKMTTERIYYDAKARLIRSETPLHIDGPDGNLEGNHWEYRMDDQQAVVEGDVRASVILQPPTSPANQ